MNENKETQDINNKIQSKKIKELSKTFNNLNNEKIQDKEMKERITEISTKIKDLQNSFFLMNNKENKIFEKNETKEIYNKKEEIINKKEENINKEENKKEENKKEENKIIIDELLNKEENKIEETIIKIESETPLFKPIFNRKIILDLSFLKRIEGKEKEYKKREIDLNQIIKDSKLPYGNVKDNLDKLFIRYLDLFKNNPSKDGFFLFFLIF
jgi:hypothetical protein